jgi:predicted phosphoribosyltransferase
MRVPFHDRRDAGRQLSEQLLDYADNPNVIVLGLPRGGVPVAYEISARIGAPLDVLVVRKLGVPGHEELAVGAIASGGIRYVDRRVAQALRIPDEVIDTVEESERIELERRERTFRAGRPPLDVSGRTTIVVDDGLATGASMAVAVEALRMRNPANIVVAVPIASTEACDSLRERADEVVCLVTPSRMYAIGQWYEDFTQTTDEEVRALLDQSSREQQAVRGSRDEAQVPMR